VNTLLRSSESGRPLKAAFLLCLAILVVATASGQSGSVLPAGMFSTLGNQVVDENRNPVRLSCVYWPGLNAKDGQFANLDGPIKGMTANVEAIAEAGFNCIRVDFNNLAAR
jgi:hypothetical protein